MHLRRRTAALALAATLPLGLTACGDDAGTTDTTDSGDEMSDEMTDDAMTEG